jgi:hypothetical protein
MNEEMRLALNDLSFYSTDLNRLPGQKRSVPPVRLLSIRAVIVACRSATATRRMSVVEEGASASVVFEVTEHGFMGPSHVVLR